MHSVHGITSFGLVTVAVGAVVSNEDFLWIVYVGVIILIAALALAIVTRLRRSEWQTD